MKNVLIGIFLLVITQPLFSQKSHFFTDSIWSQQLKTYRKINVYLPANFSKNPRYKVIYTTDGQFIDSSYCKKLDSLIINKMIVPIVIVGVYSSDKMISKDFTLRNIEYLAEGDIRFENHLHFFTEELTRFSEKKYHVSKKVKDKYFYGVSNGADFGFALSVRKPDFASSYLLFSKAAFFDTTRIGITQSKIKYYLSCGSDKDIIEPTQEICKNLTSKNIPFDFHFFKGGHDCTSWLEDFESRIVLIFNNLKK